MLAPHYPPLPALAPRKVGLKFLWPATYVEERMTGQVWPNNQGILNIPIAHCFRVAMHQLDQGERLRSFIRHAVKSPQTTIDSIAIDLAGYPPPLRTIVHDFYGAVQTFLQELQEYAVATGQADPKHDGGLENDTAGAPCRLDLLVKAGAQAEAVRSGLHTVNVAGSENNAVQRPVGDRGAEPENISPTASPSIHPAHAPALPLPLPLVTEAQEGTPSLTEEIKSDTEEKVLRLFPTTAQYHDFASFLARAKELGAENVGVFKVLLPEDMPQDFEVVDNDLPRIHDPIRQASSWYPVLLDPSRLPLTGGLHGHISHRRPRPED